MTTLIYRLADFYQPSKLILEKLENGGGEQIRFIFKDFKEGELRLGEKSVRIKDGEATLRFSSLREGQISPRLVTGTEIYTLAPLEISGGRVKSRELLSEELTELRACVLKIYASLTDICARVSTLEEKIGLSNTFKL